MILKLLSCLLLAAQCQSYIQIKALVQQSCSRIHTPYSEPATVASAAAPSSVKTLANQWLLVSYAVAPSSVKALANQWLLVSSAAASSNVWKYWPTKKKVAGHLVSVRAIRDREVIKRQLVI